MSREEPVPRCPTCAAPVAAQAPHRPFCSPRCKMVDLGRWFDETYRVPSEEAPAAGAGLEWDADPDA